MEAGKAAMAQEVTVVLEDDLTGGPAKQTVRFAFDGTGYEIDLNAKNAAVFGKQLAPYIEHARRAGRAQPHRSGRATAGRQRSGDIRAWAKEQSFRQLLPRPSAVFLVDLLVDREVRNRRRITRAKQTTQEWRDMVDQIPEDQTIRQAADADYRYIGIDTTGLDVARTVQRIKGAIPEVYAD
jgi:hypothetical protein